MKVVKILAGVIGIIGIALMLGLIYEAIFCDDCSRPRMLIFMVAFGVVGIGLLIFVNWKPLGFISALLVLALGVILFAKGAIGLVNLIMDPTTEDMIQTYIWGGILSGALIAAIGIGAVINFLPQEIQDAFSDD